MEIKETFVAISVKERLPNYANAVMVITELGIEKAQFLKGGKYSEKGEWVEFYTEKKLLYVTHWIEKQQIKVDKNEFKAKVIMAIELLPGNEVWVWNEFMLIEDIEKHDPHKVTAHFKRGGFSIFPPYGQQLIKGNNILNDTKLR